MHLINRHFVSQLTVDQHFVTTCNTTLIRLTRRREVRLEPPSNDSGCKGKRTKGARVAETCGLNGIPRPRIVSK